MDAPPVTHPSAETLRAYGLATLADADAQTVESHLSGCSTCLEQVKALSGDDFLKRLRQAQDQYSTVAPAYGASRAASGKQSPPSTSAPGTAIPDLPPELAGHPDYETIRKLGAGGMGVVYLARHRLSGREEVLKVMNKTLLAEPGSKKRFLREIQSAAMLDHQNVVKMHTALEIGELIVLVMEYGGAESLADLMKARLKENRGPIPVLNACYYIQQAALGLQHAFEKKMVHRDIKPGNLILSRQGKKHVVKVLDFGLAKVRADKGESLELTASGQIIGTLAFMAPEQTRNAAKADIRADIYSLGCTLYQLISGALPFPCKNAYEMIFAHQSVEAAPLNEVRPDVPMQLAEVVSKMMAKDPAQRYQTPVEVAQALMAIIKSGQKGAPRDSADDSPEGAASSKPARAAGVPSKTTIESKNRPASHPPHPLSRRIQPKGNG